MGSSVSASRKWSRERSGFRALRERAPGCRRKQPGRSLKGIECLLPALSAIAVAHAVQRDDPGLETAGDLAKVGLRKAVGRGKQMQRRELILLLGGAALPWPRLLHAQQKAMPVIGFLISTPPNPPLIATFHQGLSEAGYVEGR